MSGYVGLCRAMSGSIQRPPLLRRNVWAPYPVLWTGRIDKLQRSVTASPPSREPRSDEDILASRTQSEVDRARATIERTANTDRKTRREAPRHENC
jgi:hypothetical protein